MIFDDRIEIDNPGVPPVPLDELEGYHFARNKILCERFHDIGYMEEYGTGITKMKNLMKQHGLRVPQFKEQAGFFKVIFPGPGDNILDLVAKIPEDRRTDLRKLGLNKRQIETLKLMVNKGQEFNTSTYSKYFNVGTTTAKKDFKILLKFELIEKIGQGRGTQYKSKL